MAATSSARASAPKLAIARGTRPDLRALLSHRRAGVVVIGLGILLALPSLAVGFFADDYTFLVALRHRVRPFYDLFRFSTGDVEQTRHLMVSGDYPWWTALDFKLHFIRPLTSIVLAVDSFLFGNHPLGYHLDALAWYLLLLVGAWMFFRRVLSGPAATLALFVFTLRSGHALPYAWISARHVLIAAVPALFALLAHMRAVREDWRPGRILAPLLLLVGLAGSEIALGIVPFWVAYDVMAGRAKGGLRRAAWLCALAVVITAIYLVSYRLFGGGALDTPAYRNPLNDPGGFALGAIARVPTYLADALLGFPVGVSVDLPLWPVAAVGVLGVLFCVTLFVVSRSTSDPDRTTLAWVVPAALLAIGPGLSTVWGHALLLPDLGFSALIGFLLWRAIDGLSSRNVVGLERYGLAAGAAVLVVGHLLLAPLASAQTTWRLLRGGEMYRRTAMTADLGASPAKRVFLIAAPDAKTYFYARDTVEMLAPEALKCWSVLAATNAHYRFTRTGAQAFRIEQTEAPTEENYDHFFSAKRFAVGDVVEQCGATIRVDALRNGKPSILSVALDEPLDSADVVLLALDDHRFHRFPLPAIGDSLDLSKPPLVPPPVRLSNAIVPR